MNLKIIIIVILTITLVNMKSTENQRSFMNLLSRKKRFLLFPEGSAVLATMSMLKAIESSPAFRINTLTEVDFYYPLPHKVSDFFSSPKSKMKSAVKMPATMDDHYDFMDHPEIDVDSYYELINGKFVKITDNGHSTKIDDHAKIIFMPDGGWNSDFNQVLNSFDKNKTERNWIIDNRMPWKTTSSSTNYDNYVGNELDSNNRNFFDWNKISKRIWGGSPIIKPPINRYYASPINRYYITPNRIPYNFHKKSFTTNSWYATKSSNINRNYIPNENMETNSNPRQYYVGHRQRKDIYEKFGNFTNMIGIDGKQCILRMICDGKHYLLPTGKSLFHDILRILFTVPKDENDADDLYHRAANSSDPEDCVKEYGKKCPISIMAFLLHNKKYMYDL